MPWAHCGRNLGDDVRVCPTCGRTKDRWTLVPSRTRVLRVGSRLEILVRGEDGRPLGGLAYRLHSPDGAESFAGVLGAEGLVVLRRIRGREPWRLELPDLDREAWERDGEPGPAGGREPEPGPSPEPSVDPLGPGAHEVQDGESLPSIAERAGHFWATLWDDPANAELRRLRKNPNVLARGDVVHVPSLRAGEARVAPGLRHVFKRRGVPSIFRLRLLKGGRPRLGVRYVLTVEGAPERVGETDEHGVLEEYVPPQARRARLRFEGEPAVYALTIGGLRPADGPDGLRQRLVNLGLVTPGAGDDEVQRARQLLERVHGGPAEEQLQGLHDHHVTTS